MSIELKFVSNGKSDTYTVTDQYIQEAAEWTADYPGDIEDAIEQSLDMDIMFAKDLNWDAEIDMDKSDIKAVADKIRELKGVVSNGS